MYDISYPYKTMMKSSHREIDLKIVISTEEYDNSEIVELSIEKSIIEGVEFKIGEFISSKLEFTLRAFGVDIPTNAIVQPYVRFKGGLTWNEVDIEWMNADFPWVYDTSEWLPLGEFYIDTRNYNEQRLWEFKCLDKSLLFHRDYISSLTYPANMRDVLSEIAYQLDIEIRNINVIDESYKIQILPTDLTCHQVMRYIAGANGCNLTINRVGEVEFIKFDASMYDAPAEHLTRNDYTTLTDINDVKTIDTLKLYERDGYTEGEFSELVRGTGGKATTLNIVNPFINEDILDDLYAKFNGFQYYPYIMEYKCFPQLELGDVILVEQSKGSTWLETGAAWNDADFAWNYDITDNPLLILRDKIIYRGGLGSILSADAESGTESEFKPKGTLRKYIENIDKSALKEGAVYNGVTTSREYGVRVERSDKKVKVEMNATEGYSLWSDTGGGLERKFYVDIYGRIQGKGLDIFGDATFEGTIEASDIIGGTITGSSFVGGSIDIGDGKFIVDEYGDMYAESGEFKGDITGGNISVDTNVYIGNYLYIGTGTSSTVYKGIKISHGGNYSTIDVDRYGDLIINSWGGLYLMASDNLDINIMDDMAVDASDIYLNASRDIEMSTYRGDIILSSYDDIILDGYTYLWGNGSNDNRVATWSDLDDLEDYILSLL